MKENWLLSAIQASRMLSVGFVGICFGCDGDRSDDLLVLRHGCQGLAVCIESMYADAMFAAASGSSVEPDTTGIEVI